MKEYFYNYRERDEFLNKIWKAPTVKVKVTN